MIILIGFKYLVTRAYSQNTIPNRDQFPRN
jgi:hypothetical protein